MDLHLDQLGADMVAFGGHKGLHAPWGIGGLYIASSAKLKCATAQCATPDRNAAAPPAQWGNQPEYCDVGLVDQFSLAGLNAAIDSLETTLGLHDLQIARKQVGLLQDTLQRNERVTLFGTADASGRLPTIAFSVAGETSGQSALRLREYGLIVGNGLQCSGIARIDRHVGDWAGTNLRRHLSTCKSDYHRV